MPGRGYPGIKKFLKTKFLYSTSPKTFFESFDLSSRRGTGGTPRNSFDLNKPPVSGRVEKPCHMTTCFLQHLLLSYVF